MKKLLIGLATMMTLHSNLQGQGRNFQNFIGNWEFVADGSEKGGLQIVDSSTIFIRFMGEEKKLIQYKIDFSKSPYWFDFSAKDTSSVSNFKSIIEFVNDDMLKWQVFVDEDRPDHFTSGSDDVFYLRRVQKPSSAVAVASKQQ